MLLFGISALSFFQCLDTDGCPTGRTSGPQKPCDLSSKAVLQNKWRMKTEIQQIMHSDLTTMIKNISVTEP